VNPKLVALLAVPFLVVGEAHAMYPSLWLTTVLWFSAGGAILIWVHFLRRTSIPIHGAVLVAIGALCNGVVLLANDGMMPVHGVSTDFDSGAWRSAEHGGHLLFLADRMSLLSCSPGDLLVISGLLFVIGVIVVRGGKNLVRRAQAFAF
jgi:hypothetical protein